MLKVWSTKATSYMQQIYQTWPDQTLLSSLIADSATAFTSYFCYINNSNSLAELTDFVRSPLHHMCLIMGPVSLFWLPDVCEEKHATLEWNLSRLLLFRCCDLMPTAFNWWTLVSNQKLWTRTDFRLENRSLIWLILTHRCVSAFR